MNKADMGELGAAIYQAMAPAKLTKDRTDKIVRVRVKNQYGMDRVFPADPTAILFSRLIGQKTFTHRDLCLIEELGYLIEQVHEPMQYVRG